MAVYRTSVPEKVSIVQGVALFALICMLPPLRDRDYVEGMFCMLLVAFLIYMFRVVWLLQIVTDEEGITLIPGRLLWWGPAPKHMSWSAIEQVWSRKGSWPSSRKPTYVLLGTVSCRGDVLPVDGASRQKGLRRALWAAFTDSGVIRIASVSQQNELMREIVERSTHAKVDDDVMAMVTGQR